VVVGLLRQMVTILFLVLLHQPEAVLVALLLPVTRVGKMAVPVEALDEVALLLGLELVGKVLMVRSIIAI
jgi:hypothetical protein